MSQAIAERIQIVDCSYYFQYTLTSFATGRLLTIILCSLCHIVLNQPVNHEMGPATMLAFRMISSLSSAVCTGKSEFCFRCRRNGWERTR